MFGNGSVVSRVQALDNAVRGVNVQGEGNTVEKTKAFGNVEVGITLFVDDNTARSNNAQDSQIGISPAGDHVVIANTTVRRNAQWGVLVLASATLSRNQVGYNSIGIGLEGTGHALSLNVVSGSRGDGRRPGLWCCFGSCTVCLASLTPRDASTPAATGAR